MVRLDVNAMLGVGGDVGYRGCEPRIEGIVQCTKRYCTILRKFKKCGVGGGAIFEPKTLSRNFWVGRGSGRGWGRVGGVRVDVNEELKVLGKFTKKSGSGGGEGGVGGVGLVGVRLDVNAK